MAGTEAAPPQGAPPRRSCVVLVEGAATDGKRPRGGGAGAPAAKRRRRGGAGSLLRGKRRRCVLVDAPPAPGGGAEGNSPHFVFVANLSDGIQRIYKTQLAKAVHCDEGAVRVDWTTRTGWLRFDSPEAAAEAAGRLKRYGRLFGRQLTVDADDAPAPGGECWVRASGLNEDMAQVWESVLRSRFLGQPGFSKALVDWSRRMARLRFTSAEAAAACVADAAKAGGITLYGKTLALAVSSGFAAELQLDGFARPPRAPDVAAACAAAGAVLRAETPSRGAPRCVLTFGGRDEALAAAAIMQGKRWACGGIVNAKLIEHSEKRGAKYRRQRERRRAAAGS
eukprot:TRINITY_DN7019_c0_g1_i1.p2 TRINITY_DN7019_c0_g1~~TRINITY_DN7019_c0_g1_i1.p2  ORF type:complete len:338 (+),score=100.36 TRINITY_DN7019_c0_g1_i1:77-1090(+)